MMLDNSLFPVLMIPSCAVLINATAPRIVGALAELHHATHEECQVCAAHERTFRMRVRLLTGATFSLLIGCFAFAFSGMLGGLHHFAQAVPEAASAVLMIAGIGLLLGGCGLLAWESILLHGVVSMPVPRSRHAGD